MFVKVITHFHTLITTSSSAVGKRPHDASYLLVVSFIASIVQYLEHSLFYCKFLRFQIYQYAQFDSVLLSSA